MPGKKLVLHMGAHKTGSSALQVGFVRNRSILREAGVDYPESHTDRVVNDDGVDSGNGLALVWHLVPRMAPRNRDVEAELEGVVQRIVDSPHPTVLYSSEFLYQFDEDRWLEFVRRMECEGVEVHSALYVRDISGHAVSMYSQELKRGLCTSSFREFIDPEKGGQYDPGFERPMKILQRCLGAERAHVFHYDSVKRAIFPHFVGRVLAMELAEADSVERTINRSLTAFEMGVMMKANASLTGKKAARQLSDLLIRTPPPARSTFWPVDEDLKVVRDRFAGSVSRINDLGVEDGTLALEGAERPDHAGTTQDLSLTDREEFLVKLLVEMANS